MRAIIAGVLLAGLSVPAFAILPGQVGRYVGKATVKYYDLGATKPRTYSTPLVLVIESNGTGSIEGEDIDHLIQVRSGTYHGLGYFVDGQRVGNIPIHFKNGNIKGTFHLVYPGTSEMFEGKFSAKKQPLNM